MGTYRFVDAIVLRATQQPHTWQGPWPDLADCSDDAVEKWSRWLALVWQLPGFAVAVEAASSSLAARVRQVCDCDRTGLQDARSVVHAVMRYLLRATGRPTPFGLFSGVAPAGIGSRSSVQFGTGHRAIARVGSEWLAPIVALLETDPDILRQLRVATNNAAFVRDGRLVASCQPPTGTAAGSEPVEISVRHTAPVQAIMDAAAAPVLVSDLIEKLQSEFPGSSVARIDAVVAELVTQRFLLTNLRPPMTVTDPLGHVAETLVGIGPEIAGQAAELLTNLRELQSDIDLHNAATESGLAKRFREIAGERMGRVGGDQRPSLGLDLRLDAHVVLPEGVAEEAEQAASLLMRLSPHPAGPKAWQDYHSRFVERYGMGALVPVKELVDPDIGLGCPAGYRRSAVVPSDRHALTERDDVLLDLAQRAALDRRTEVVLDKATIDKLAPSVPRQVPPHTELRLRVHSPSVDALDKGDFELIVAGVSRSAGTTTGRFLDLFDDADRDRMAKAYIDLPTANEGAITAHASCPAIYPTGDNISRSFEIGTPVLTIGEHHPPGNDCISIDDLAVSGDAQRLYLVSASRQQLIEPVAFNAIEFVNHAPPLLRFLCEISTAHLPVCVPFTWGAASALPFLPRVRHGKTVLAPARWVLHAHDLLDEASDRRTSMERVAAWKRQRGVPDTVDLGEFDRRLRLDLTEPAHLHLLQAELQRSNRVVVSEAPGADALGWTDGRASEVVIPLTSTGPPAAKPTWAPRLATRSDGHLPGAGDWLYLKLYGHPDHQTTILTRHIPALLAAWDAEPVWWFLRYHDPDDHLRLRIRIRPDDGVGDVIAKVGEWASELRRAGLLSRLQWDTYYPETGRFGPGDAMSAAEAVFNADSAAAVAELEATENRQNPIDLHAVVAASMVDLACAFHGGRQAGMRWLIDDLTNAPGPGPARKQRDQAIRLTRPFDDRSGLTSVPGGARISATWQRRARVLVIYRTFLAEHENVPPDQVLRSLLHLHHFRTVGTSPESEQLCAHLARAAALSWTARWSAEAR